MTRDRRRGADDTSSAAGEARATRLGAALRANLQRRKAQVRARAEASDSADTGTTEPREPPAED